MCLDKLDLMSTLEPSKYNESLMSKQSSSRKRKKTRTISKSYRFRYVFRVCSVNYRFHFYCVETSVIPQVECTAYTTR